MLQRDADVKFSTGASGPPRLSSVPQPVNPPGPGKQKHECYVVSERCCMVVIHSC